MRFEGEWFDSIDEILGPAPRRYFGGGHRRVGLALSNIAIDPLKKLPLTAVARLTYPDDWSTKDADPELRPHLSSIDAVVLSAQLIECYLAARLGLDSQARSRAWIRSASVRAGGKPWLALDTIPLGVSAVESRKQLNALGDRVTRFDCRVGGISLQVEVEHEAGLPHDGRVTFDTSDDLLGLNRNPYYGAGHKAALRNLEDVRVDVPQGRTACVSLIELPADGKYDGLSSAYCPTLSVVDAILVGAQLAQALIYRWDGIGRETSSTLWMRKFSLNMRTPYQPVEGSFVPQVRTRSARLTRMAESTWRLMDLDAQILGVSGSMSIAHMLPLHVTTAS